MIQLPSKNSKVFFVCGIKFEIVIESSDKNTIYVRAEGPFQEQGGSVNREFANAYGDTFEQAAMCLRLNVQTKLIELGEVVLPTEFAVHTYGKLVTVQAERCNDTVRMHADVPIDVDGESGFFQVSSTGASISEALETIQMEVNILIKSTQDTLDTQL